MFSDQPLNSSRPQTWANGQKWRYNRNGSMNPVLQTPPIGELGCPILKSPQTFTNSRLSHVVTWSQGAGLEGWIASQLRVDRAVDARARACISAMVRKISHSENRSNERLRLGYLSKILQNSALFRVIGWAQNSLARKKCINSCGCCCGAKVIGNFYKL